jgi:hypothetical protein
MEDIFNEAIADKVINRIDSLNKSQKPLWGKMSASQMLAHCNVTYDMIFTDKYPKPRGLKRFLLKLLIKNLVVNEKPYRKSSQTAPDFVINDQRDFEVEKKKLIDNIRRTVSLGRNHFEGKESHSFGSLNANEWNNMLYKHLDHHLSQFGV